MVERNMIIVVLYKPDLQSTGTSPGIWTLISSSSSLPVYLE